MKLSRAIILLTLHLWYKWPSVICIQGTSEYFTSFLFSRASLILLLLIFWIKKKKKNIFSNFYEHSSNFTSIEIIPFPPRLGWETFFMLITLLRRVGCTLGEDKRFELEAIIFSTDNVFNLIPLSRLYIDITVNVLWYTQKNLILYLSSHDTLYLYPSEHSFKGKICFTLHVSRS